VLPWAAILSDAARKEPSYLAFLDALLGEERDAKQKKRVAMGIQIAHFPVAKTVEDFDFKSSRRSTPSSFAS
jgi:DNA replication protein DnaC